MTHSFMRVYVHLVWHTKYREPILAGRLEEYVLGEIRGVFDEFDLVTAAVNAAWDHVHTLVGWQAELSIAEIVQRAKGRSAFSWNQHERQDDEPKLKWQRGYGAVSVSPDRVDRVIGYIDRQKRYHRNQETSGRYECIGRRPDDAD